MLIVAYIVVIAALVAFVVTFLRISKILDTVIMKQHFIIQKAFFCDFCLSFWITLILSVIIVVITKNAVLLLTPVITTPVSKNLL